MTDEEPTGWHGYRNGGSAVWFAVDPSLDGNAEIVVCLMLDGVTRRVATCEDVISATLLQDWMDEALVKPAELHSAWVAYHTGGADGGDSTPAG